MTPSSSSLIAHRALSTAALAVIALTFTLWIAGCSGMTQQEKSTAVGAGVGAIGGAILTGGSTAGTLGGAAVGGVIGHEVDKPK
jgi:osmotically inducible lipoprotein OsmB